MEAMLVMSKRSSTSGLIPQSMSVGDTDVYFSDLVKNLGVTLDSSLSMHRQVTNTCTGWAEIRENTTVETFSQLTANRWSVCRHQTAMTTKVASASPDREGLV